MIEFLISEGHSDALNYTPRQAAVFAKEAVKRRKAQGLQDYSITRAAHHADKEADKKIRKDFENG